MDYGELATHRLMVRDEVRTAAFGEAIAAVVKSGDVVLDLGAGCGILSLFAARAGAARVYAVERDPHAAACAQALVQQNGFADVVKVVCSDIRSAGIPEQVDLIVSEWMGTIGIDENMYGAVLWARDALLAKDGRIIPASVTAMLAPAAPAQRADSGFFNDHPYGFDMSPLGEPVLNELMMVRRRVVNENLAASGQPLWTMTAATDTPETVRQPAQAELSFVVGRSLAVTALAAWFKADLGGGVTLSNAPNAPDTHWGQMLFPLNSRLSLTKGDTLDVGIKAWPVGPGPLMFAWRWRVNDGPEAELDTMGGTSSASMAQDAENAAAPELPTARSALSRFLAQLALDPDQLAAFLADPDATMAELSTEHADALRSRDAYRIGMALYEKDVAA